MTLDRRQDCGGGRLARGEGAVEDLVLPGDPGRKPSCRDSQEQGPERGLQRGVWGERREQAL